MKKYSLFLVLSLNLLVLLSLVSPTHGQSAFISLSPDMGISTITIEGSGFMPHSTITVSWSSEPIPTLPLHVITDETGVFTCIISVYNQTSAGDHEVQAMDQEGTVAVATFTVIDVKGPQGEEGLPGDPAEGVSPGYFAGWLLLAAAIGGLTGALLGRHQGSESKSRTQSLAKAT